MRGFGAGPGRQHPAPSSGVLALRVAACVAALLLAGGLVLRMSVGLSSASPQARALAESEDGIALSSDVVGRPLFDDVVLVPDRPVEACITIRTHAAKDIAPVGLFLTGYSGDRALADAVRVEVSQQEGEGSESCAGFTPESVLLAGTLTDAMAAHHDGASSARHEGSGRTTWYRVRVTLPAEVAAGGRIGDLGIAWTTSSLPGPTFGDQALLLAYNLAEGSIIPLLLMLVLSVLFIGIQDRIDRSDPKLALAPVLQEDLPFLDPRDLGTAPGSSSRQPIRLRSELAVAASSPWDDPGGRRR